MLIIALVLALIGLVALVFAVVTSNELVAWVCIGASVLGVVLLIIDALRERQRRDAGIDDQDDAEAQEPADAQEDAYVDYPEEEDQPETGGHETAQDADATKESKVSAEGRGDEPAK
jgi:heme exporter protein D